MVLPVVDVVGAVPIVAVLLRVTVLAELSIAVTLAKYAPVVVPSLHTHAKCPTMSLVSVSPAPTVKTFVVEFQFPFVFENNAAPDELPPLMLLAEPFAPSM